MTVIVNSGIRTAALGKNAVASVLRAGLAAAAAQGDALCRVAGRNKAATETQRKREMSINHTARQLAQFTLRDPYANMDADSAAWNREVDAKKRIKQNIKVEKEYAKRSDDLDTFRENLRIEQIARQMAAGLKGPIECKMKLPKE